MQKQNSRLYLLLFMGILSAFGPFVTDFYLPALPYLGRSFGVSAPTVQLSLTVCMAGLALGQLVVGPLSDRYGRRGPLLWSLVLFLVSTAGCLWATRIGWFVAARFFQGIAGAGGLVLSKSVAADLYRGEALARFFAMLVSVQGIAPVAAPVLGGLMMKVTGWEGIFAALLVLGVALLFAGFRFRESLPADRRSSVREHSFFGSFVPVLRNRGFMRYVAVQMFGMGTMFAYIAASPFMFQQHYGLSPLAYGLCFAFNALGIMGGGLLVPVLGNALRALAFGSRGFALAGTATAVFLALRLSVYWVEAGLFVTLGFLGMILPASTSLAMDRERNHAGKASALLGASQFLFGGALSPLAGMGNIFLPTAAIIAFCCLCTLVFTGRIRR